MEERIKEIEEYIISLRRYFHKYPEASLREYNTSKKIIDELIKLDIPYKIVGETGVIGFIGKNENKKSIALRADIDALEIEDQKNVVYKSKNPGLMHACGHDGHTASLLGACKILKEIEDKIDGQIKVIFQQAEEIGQGARLFGDAGYLEDVSSAFALHFASSIETGKVAISKGAIAASCDYFKAEFIGRSGHVSKPSESLDALYMASNAVVNVQSIVSRHIDPLDPVVIGIGVLESGTRYNIIAGNAILEGTFRTFSSETRKKVKDGIEEIFKSSAYNNGGDLNIEFKSYSDPLINDDNEVDKVIRIANNIVGEDNLILDKDKSLGSDDFAEFSKYTKTIYIHIGSGNKANKNTQVAHHNEYFDLDESSLLIACKFYIEYALNEFNII